MDLLRTTWLRGYVALFAVTGMLMAGAVLATGANLGAFLAGLALCALILPWAISDRQTLREQLLAGACVVDAIATVWFVLALAGEQTTLVHWLKAYVLLLGVAALPFGIVSLMRRGRCPGVLAATVGVLVMLLWLCAPVWLLHHLQTPGLLPWMQRIIDVHPLFAMNSAVPMGVWTESPLAYRVLNLNQDVYYQMPKGPWWASAGHALLGGLLIWVNAVCCQRTYKQDN